MIVARQDERESTLQALSGILENVGKWRVGKFTTNREVDESGQRFGTQGCGLDPRLKDTYRIYVIANVSGSLGVSVFHSHNHTQ